MINKILNYKTLLYRLLLFCGFLLWVFLVYKNLQIYAFNTDEMWAWDIAHDLTFSEITQLMHYEGHSFIWYMLIKPFTLLADKFPVLFPDIIKYLNLAFLGAAMFLLWMCSPINIFLKLLISVTSPFVITYPALARPYGLLILLLFIVVMLYKNRLKHPLVYAALLFIIMHTCWNGLIGAMFLGGFFIYDLYKENKSNFLCSKVLVPTFIICSAFVMLAIEWIPLFPPLYIKYFGTWNVFYEFFLPNVDLKYYNLISLFVWGPCLLTVALIHFSSMKNKRFLLFGAYIFYSFFIFYLIVAPGRYHHLYFIYIYFIVIYWMLLENSEEFINNRLNFYSMTGIIALISVLYFIPFRDPHFWFINKYDYEEGIQRIKEIAPQGSKMYLILDYGAMAIPRLKDYYDLRTQYNYKIPSLKAYQSIYQDYYLLPQDIYVKQGETAYYVLPVAYLTAMQIKPLFQGDNCESAGYVYVICTIKAKNSENNE